MILPTIPWKKLKGKKVLVRVDFNEPIGNGRVLNDFRIRRTIPTIEKLSRAKAKVILISHMDSSVSKTLKPVAMHLKKFIKVGFVPETTGSRVKEIIGRMRSGDVILLENLRSDKGEETNSFSFAKKLASSADMYVNEAFSVSHRKHASFVALPKLIPSYAGPLFIEEWRELSKLLKPQKPLLLILGGAKFDTKIPLVKKYLKDSEAIFLGGAISNSVFKFLGYEIGKSSFGGSVGDVKELLKSKKIIIPEDVITNSGEIKHSDCIERGEIVSDIGPESLSKLKKILYGKKTIIFNGPLGIYNEGFDKGTRSILKALAKSKGRVVLGGGDTLVLVSEMKLEKSFSFVSTAGGAMLEFLVKGTLPGIEALVKYKK